MIAQYLFAYLLNDCNVWCSQSQSGPNGLFLLEFFYLITKFLQKKRKRLNNHQPGPSYGESYKWPFKE